MWVVLMLLVLMAITSLVWIAIARSRRRLSGAATSRIRAMIQRADLAGDPVLRIIEYDKILDQLLLELGFQGTAGEKLMKGAARFSNKEALWKCHKLRNIIAHQHGAIASMADADHFQSVLQHAFAQVAR